MQLLDDKMQKTATWPAVPGSAFCSNLFWGKKKNKRLEKSDIFAK
jgi:hypothetical protein